ncbi:hypothetical protein ACFZAE_39700 [Streptomyces scabiei]|uniref:hypothetical protein n=1 Tax=Streptomyces TaxID=1883 RepID=UPI001BFF309B|nr:MULTISPECIES: hypothetical protein [unclassified Streptomyces]
MPADHYTVLRALLQAEAHRSAPATKPESERTSERSRAGDSDKQPRRDPNHG